jgi:hypothetical protein
VTPDASPYREAMIGGWRLRRASPRVDAAPAGYASTGTAPTASVARHPPPVARGTMILVALAAATVTVLGISALRGILAPTLLTLVLVICANPVRTFLLKKGVPGGIATGAVILVVFGLLAGFTYTILIAFAQFIAMLPSYSAQFADIGQHITGWLSSLGIPPEARSVSAGIDPGSIATAVSEALGSVVGITGALVIVLTMMILMAADAVFSRTILGQLSTHKPDLVVAVGRYAVDVRRYMVVTAVLGMVQGALNAIALYILQAGAGCVAVGPSRFPLQLHPQHRVLLRDHPAPGVRLAGRRVDHGGRDHHRLRPDQRNHPIRHPATLGGPRRVTQPDHHVFLSAFLGCSHRPDRGNPRHSTDLAGQDRAGRRQPGGTLVAPGAGPDRCHAQPRQSRRG